MRSQHAKNELGIVRAFEMILRDRADPHVDLAAINFRVEPAPLTNILVVVGERFDRNLCEKLLVDVAIEDRLVVAISVDVQANAGRRRRWAPRGY